MKIHIEEYRCKTYPDSDLDSLIIYSVAKSMGSDRFYVIFKFLLYTAQVSGALVFLVGLATGPYL